MKIEHIATYTKDLELAKDFFTRYFGAVSNELYHNPRTGFRSYFLSFDGDTRLEIMSAPGLKEGDVDHLRIGSNHMAFAVGSKEAVDTLTAQLKSDGYQVISGPRTTGDGYYESCILGFEGNLIEITI